METLERLVAMSGGRGIVLRLVDVVVELVDATRPVTCGFKNRETTKHEYRVTMLLQSVG